MAIIEEDGSIVAGANSYVERADFIAYAAERGFTAIPDDDTTDVLLIKAMDYIESQSFIGDLVQDGIPVPGVEPTLPTQPLQWPRMYIFTGDDVAGYTYFIPPGIRKAQLQLALDISNGFDPSPNMGAGSAGRIVTSEKIGPISRSYSDESTKRLYPFMPIVEAALRPYLVGMGAFGVQTLRV